MARQGLRLNALDRVARVAQELSGLDAAVVCLRPTRSAPIQWGAHGLSEGAVQTHVLASAWPAIVSGQVAPEDWLVLTAGKPRQHAQAPLQDAGGADTGLLLALGFSEPAAGNPAPLIVERLARSLSAEAAAGALLADANVPDGAGATSQLAARLRGAMRAMQMGSWVYTVAPRQLSLSDDAAAILGVTDRLPRKLDDLLQSFTAESAHGLRQAFVACIRQGRPIDTEVQFAGAAATRRWMRFIGEASKGPDGSTHEIHGAVQDVSTRRQAQEETVRLAMRLTTTLASINEAFVTLDRQSRFMYVNRESEQLLGHSTRELLGEPIQRWLLGQTPGLLQRELQDALARNQRVEFEDFYPVLDKWLEVRAHPYAEGLAVYFRDVTERRLAQERLMLLQTGIAHLNDIVLIAEVVKGHSGQAARIAFVNDAFERQTGLSRHEVVGHDTGVLVRTVGTDALQELIKSMADPEAFTLRRREMLLRHRDGSTYWMDLDVVPVRAADGRITHWVTVGRDVTARRQADEKIHHLAYFDPLTELPNRLLLIERLQAALADSERSGQSGALMFIDLDNFKVLNDTLGHSRGDLLLQRVAERLRRSVRRSDTVARIGGDEFVVMLQGLGTDPVASAAKTHRVATKVLLRMSEPFDLGDYQHYCTVSIGVTGFGARHDGVSELLKQADLAMYQAKAMGRDTIAFFDPAMQAAVSARAALGADLRVALQAGDQFRVYYQPLFDRQRRVVGLEALLRWQHPQRGAVSPAEFIPVAEDTGLILPLGAWVLEQACAQLAQWALRPETAQLSISVNVSVRQFRHPEFVDQVIASISRHRVAPRLLKLELTESLMADRMEITLEKMDTLRQLGVTLSLDDFGTGYSSLAYLKRLPIDVIKLDRCFIGGLPDDPYDLAIVQAMSTLAQRTGIGIVAEGVETQAQARTLRECGVQRAQGFLFSASLDNEELVRGFAG